MYRGNVVSFEIFTKKLDNDSIIPELLITPIIPKYKGNCINIPEAPVIAFSTAFKNLLKFWCIIIAKPNNTKLIKSGFIIFKDTSSGMMNDLQKAVNRIIPPKIKAIFLDSSIFSAPEIDFL